MAIYTPTVEVSVANPNRDGTGTLVTAFTAVGAAVVNSITVTAVGTTTDGMIRVFLDDGANIWLRYEILVEDIIPSATVAAFARTVIPLGFTVEAGTIVKVATEKAEVMNVNIVYTE